MSPSRINGGNPPTPTGPLEPSETNDGVSAPDGTSSDATGLPGLHRDGVSIGSERVPGNSIENAGTRAMSDVIDPSRSNGMGGGPRTPRFHLSPEVRNLVSTASDDYLFSVVADWANDIDSLIGIA
jgi:hypothetical protein